MRRVVFSTLFAVACHTSAPLAPSDPRDAPLKAERPDVVGGKGFVAPRATPPVPPLSLTATDGSGLKLVALDANAKVDDPVALTELDLTFENPRPVQVEGKFEVALPPGAMVTRFAMKIAGKWQEGEVVPRQKGRQVYESFLHERRDPALLEVETGNRFGARVFPIRASGTVEIKVSYLQTFAEPEVAYRLPLRGLPKIASMHLGVAGAVAAVEREASDQRPRQDLEVPRKAAPNAAWRFGRHAIARVTVPEDFGDEVDAPASIVMLFDTSASRASQFSTKVERFGELVGALGKRVAPQTKLTVLPFDQAVGASVFEGRIDRFDQGKVTRALVNRRALGASDLARALRSAGKLLPERIVVVTDGMITAGLSDATALGKRAEALADQGVRRIDVVAGLDRRDDAVLTGLVTADLPQAGVVIDADQGADEIAMRLLRPTAPTIAVRAPGATRVWPEELRGRQAGDAVLVFAEVGKRATTFEIELQAAGGNVHTRALKLATTKNPAFDRAFVREDVEQQLRRIASLPMKNRIATQRRLEKLSVDHRILNGPDRVARPRDRAGLRPLRDRSEGEQRHPHPGGATAAAPSEEAEAEGVVWPTGRLGEVRPGRAGHGGGPHRVDGGVSQHPGG